MDLELALLNRLAKLEKSVDKQKNFAMRKIDEALIRRIKADLAAFAA
jgi:hypothetical protein